MTYIMSNVTPDQYARQELESEWAAAWDDHHERYAGEALNPEYEAYCHDQNVRDDEGLPPQTMAEWRADCAATEAAWIADMLTETAAHAGEPPF